MFLLGEILNKQYLFRSFYLLGFEMFLTIIMLYFISKNEDFYGSIENLSVKEMLAATKMQ